MESVGIINEIWRTITGFVNYQVSNIGRVRNTNTGRILKPSRNARGYDYVTLYQDKVLKQMRVHRLVALEFIENPDNKPSVDHINGDKTNNCLSNIRWVNQSDNGMNIRKRYKNSTSIYKGVYWYSRYKKWSAQIMLDRKNIHIGYFHDEKDAARAYNKKALELFGKYACLNNISDDDDDEETVLSGDPLNTHYL